MQISQHFYNMQFFIKRIIAGGKSFTRISEFLHVGSAFFASFLSLSFCPKESFDKVTTLLSAFSSNSKNWLVKNQSVAVSYYHNDRFLQPTVHSIQQQF